MLKIIRSKETSQIAVVTGSERNKWKYSEQRCIAHSNFRNKKREYLKGKINEISENSKNKNNRDLHTGGKLI
jgi:hypothetical protein